MEIALQEAAYSNPGNPVRPSGIPPMSNESNTPATLIDWVRLRAQFAYKPSFLNTLLEVMLQQSLGAPAQLRVMAQSRDYPALAALAHGIKGSCAHLTAATVSTLALITETAARSGQSDATIFALELADLLDALLLEIQAQRGTEASG